MNSAVLHALAAALLFGASTPLAKLLTGDVPPLLLAGLLYLGGGGRLCVVRLLRDQGWQRVHLPPGEWRWLLGETASLSFWLARALMGLGVWLHLTEHHEHSLHHDPLAHSHRRAHHPHFPDILHRHSY